MNYLLRNRGKRRWAQLKTPAVVLIFLLIIFLFTYLEPAFLPNLALRVGSPLFKTANFFSEKFYSLKSLVVSKTKLEEENNRLRKIADENAAALLELDSYKKENDNLKKLAGREGKTRRVLAAVLAMPPRSAYDTLILDTGKDRGVKNGDLIAINDNIIGEILDAYDTTSKAALFSTSGKKIDAVIATKSAKIPATIFGRGAGNFFAELPRGVPVETGDAVRIPGMAMEIAGVVGETVSGVADSFQTIFIKSPVAIGSLDFVEILLND